MGKKILIILAVILVAIILGLVYLNHQNRTLSPPGMAELTHEGLKVSIDYSRPSVRDRLIFGKDEEGALLPHGKYWRLGANEPTIMEVNQDFMFGPTAVKAGKYTLYATPESQTMLLRLNEEILFWGIIEPDVSKDVADVLVDMVDNEKTEQLTIICEPMNGGVKAVFSWDTYRWEIPITKQ